MTLVRISGQHRRAVERDLIALGFSGWDDVGVNPRLSLGKLISIVLASPPNTAVYHAETRSGTMTPEQQILSQAFGQVPEWVSQSPEAEPEPVLEDPLTGLASMTIGNQSVILDALPPDELKAKREEIAAKIRATEGQSRDQVHTEKYDPFEAGKRLRAERQRQIAQEQQASNPVVRGGLGAPALPDHIAGSAQGPTLPDHMRGVL